MTKEERSWLRKMQKLLDKCPSHFEFNTVGDCNLTVFDNRKRDEIDAIHDAGGCEFCGAIDAAGAYIGDLIFPNNVHSTTG